LEFLGARLFRFENPRFRGWISLDFLGFPWILSYERDLSMGYAGFSLKSFSWPLLPFGQSKRRDERSPARLCRSAEVFIEQALTHILIFCNSLSPRPFLSRESGKWQHRFDIGDRTVNDPLEYNLRKDRTASVEKFWPPTAT
jgi:hypothetical protein